MTRITSQTSNNCSKANYNIVPKLGITEPLTGVDQTILFPGIIKLQIFSATCTFGGLCSVYIAANLFDVRRILLGPLSLSEAHFARVRNMSSYVPINPAQNVAIQKVALSHGTI